MKTFTKYLTKTVVTIALCISMCYASVAVPVLSDMTAVTAEAANSKVKSIKVTNLSSKKLTLKKGKSKKLKVKVTTKGKKTSKEVGFKSSDEAVAVVNANGKITAIGKGTAKITVYAKADESKKIVIKVTVKGNKKSGEITEKQACKGVLNYYKKQGYDFDSWEKYYGYIYCDKTKSGYKVTFRSYTAAFTYFYVNKKTGYTYITEYVPMISDEEMKTGESFNIRDYIK